MAGYSYNKDVNLFLGYIPGITSITEETRQRLLGEAYYMRAYTYYALAKRYGGVPIITSIPEVSDSLSLYAPRNTEKETWDFALSACDSAAMFLPVAAGNGRRANKWAALALKSRIALHAASVAKYWNEAPLSGDAADAKLVGGMTQADALGYYSQCIAAAEEIMDNGPYGLFRPAPANATEAAENYRVMFELPANALEEVIFIKGFERQGTGYGSNQDCWGNPSQTRGAFPHPGRWNPSLDLIDTYESYSSPGQSSPVVTTADGVTNNYTGYNASNTYLTFDDPEDIFADKDARMHGAIIYPGAIWKGVKIVIQGGFIRPDGTALIEGPGEEVVDGVTYYTYGAPIPDMYSGFDTYGSNMTRTGFLPRKFLRANYAPQTGWNNSTTDFIDLRYAEVLLNYAEAVVESGQGNQAKAAKAINDLRHRAAHTSDIPLTLENVLRERRVERVFEGYRYWDLMRRREYHKVFNNTRRTALVPIFDLRDMKYIFVRQYASRTTGRTFTERNYYKSIPGTAANYLIQNPQY